MPLSTVLGAQSLVQPGVCTTATRPASPYTGQMIYDTTVATTLVWSGTAWIASGGKVLQVVNGSTSTDTTNSTTTYATTTLTATITPTSTTSKVLVFVNQNVGKSVGNTDSYAWMQLKRDSTVLSTFYVGPYTGTSVYFLSVSATTSHLDSPATTSATVYSTQFKNNVAADGARVQWQNATSTITLIEVSA